MDAILGVWNRFEISDNQRRLSGLESKQGELISVLEKAALKIAENEHNIRKIRGSLVDQLRWDKEINYLLFLKSHFSAIRRAVTEFRFALTNLSIELSKLLSGFPPLGLFHSHRLEAVVASLVHQAEADGYVLHVPVREAKMSHSLHGHTLHFHFHLPFVMRDKADVYQYIDMPIPLSNSSFHAWLHERFHREKLLLVSPDRTAVAETTTAFLQQQCTRGENTWSCPQSFLFTRNPQNHCLSRLLLFPNLNPKPVCTFRLSPARNHLLQLHHSLLVWGENLQVQLHCPNGTSYITVEGFHSIGIPPGCQFSTPEWFLTSSKEDLSAAITISYTQYLAAIERIERTMRLEDVFYENISNDLLFDLFNHTQQLSFSPPLDTSHLATLQRQHARDRTVHVHTYVITAIITIIIGLVICTSVAAVYFFRPNFCPQRHPPVQDEPITHYNVSSPQFYWADVTLPRIKEVVQ